jgi:hypothetical protein
VTDAAPSRDYGVGRGKVFPAAKARSLLNPLRRIVQSPRAVVERIGLAPSARVLELGCETRRDSDFLRVDQLRARFEPVGFRYVGRRGIAWEYQATFEAS